MAASGGQQPGPVSVPCPTRARLVARPEADRHRNDYVQLHLSRPRVPSRRVPSDAKPPARYGAATAHQPVVITSQPISQRRLLPASARIPVRPGPSALAPSSRGLEPKKKAVPSGGGTRPSHICRECGRCRCSACTSPGPDFASLGCWPTDTWQCTPQGCVEAATCACCLRAAYFHCHEGGGDCGPPPPPEHSRWFHPPAPLHPRDTPGRKCLRNWTLVALASLVLPCLCCYPPLLALKTATGAGYSAWRRRRGCRCAGDAPPSRSRSLPSSRRVPTMSSAPASLTNLKLINNNPYNNSSNQPQPLATTGTTTRRSRRKSGSTEERKSSKSSVNHSSSKSRSKVPPSRQKSAPPRIRTVDVALAAAQCDDVTHNSGRAGRAGGYDNMGKLLDEDPL